VARSLFPPSAAASRSISPRQKPSRRRFLPLLAGTVTLLAPGQGNAEDDTVPPAVQARLISRVPSYDRGFRERARDRVHVLVLLKRGDVESERSGKLMSAAIARQDGIAQLPHDVAELTFSDSSALATEVKKRSVTIVYVTPGLDAEVGTICATLQPLQVMTITSVTSFVQRCVVVGFEVESGKPKMSVHLESAKKSGLRFSSQFLRLAKVYR
jgi:hypothetical protein